MYIHTPTILIPFKVRATGTYDTLTHQPVKGRKKGGGVRFGEMERDAMIAHGTSFLLQDRLLNCSDLSEVCKLGCKAIVNGFSFYFLLEISFFK